MFMIWDSSHEDLQLFDWVSNTASYGFISLYVNPPSYSYDRVFFRNLTFKIQGQSHSSRSHNRNNILSTHIPFIPCWSALPFLRCSYLKKLTLKFQGQGWGQSSKPQSKSNILSTHIPLVPCQSALPFPRYSIFKIWLWKSKVKVIAQSHKVGITPYRLISLLFHVDRPCHSWDTAISKFDVENSRSRSRVRSKLKVITWVLHSVDSHPFRSMSIGHPVPELWLFQNLTLKIKGQGHGWGHNSKS